MSSKIELFEQAIDDFGHEIFFYVNGATIRRDSVNGMWRLYDEKNKNLDNDQFRFDLMQRNGYQMP
jgi:hypothetical protein